MIQPLDVVTVAARKAADAFAQLREPVLVDDTGLAVHAWDGLPGALVVWFLGTVGPQGILDMAAGLTDRRATVSTALGLRRRQRSAGISGNRGRLPGRRAAQHLRLRLRPDLHPRHRQRPPHLRPDDQRGKNKISHRGARSRQCETAWDSNDPPGRPERPATPCCPRRSRTGRPGADPCDPFPPHPTVGRPGRTQSPRGRDRSRCRQFPSSPAIRPGYGRPRPSLGGTSISGARCRRPRRAP